MVLANIPTFIFLCVFLRSFEVNVRYIQWSLTMKRHLDLCVCVWYEVWKQWVDVMCVYFKYGINALFISYMSYQSQGWLRDSNGCCTQNENLAILLFPHFLVFSLLSDICHSSCSIYFQYTTPLRRKWFVEL